MNFVKMLVMMTVIDLAMDTGVDLTVTKLRKLINKKFPDSDIDDGFIGTFLEQLPERLSMFTTMMVMQQSSDIMNKYIEPMVNRIIDGVKDTKIYFKLAKTVLDTYKTVKSGKIKLGRAAGGVAAEATTALAKAQTNELTEGYMKFVKVAYYKQDLGLRNADVMLNSMANLKIANNTNNLNKKNMTTEEFQKILASLLESKKYGG